MNCNCLLLLAYKLLNVFVETSFNEYVSTITNLLIAEVSIMNKKLIGALLVLSFPLTAIPVKSQQEDSGSLDKDQRIERMTKELGLNEEQTAKVESIFNDQKKKLKTMHGEKRTLLQGVLTQEQMTKLDKIHQQRQPKQSTTGNEGGDVAP
jgi:hypothetical protein